MRDHQPIVIENIKGLFDRGENENVPLDHLVAANNVIYTNYGVKSRFGSDVAAQGIVPGGGMRRAHLYKLIGEAIPREIVLAAGGAIIDLGTGTTIATIGGADDFFGITLYNRFYFTPIASFSDGIRAVAGQNLYVYNGTGVARVAAGVGPVAGLITAVAGGAGKVEAGLRLFAVAFETASGFITKAGPTVFTQFTGAGATVVNLAAIPLGPAGTVARHVLVSKVVRGGWTGNQNDIELFFIPGGRIGDNVTLVYAANFYDAELQASADHLLDELTTIPAGVHLAEFKGRLGIAYGNDIANLGLYRLSKIGEPESFSSIDGFCLVGPGDTTGVNAAAAFRDNLLLKKDAKFYLTSDNGGEPSTWEVIKIDDNIGCTHNGIVKGIDNTGAVNPDVYMFASATGIILFNGTIQFPPLTDKISDVWRRIVKSKLHLVHIIQDPVNKRLYIPVPLDGATNPNYWIYGDYSDGLDAQNIKWALWQVASLNNVPQSVYLFYNVATRDLQVKFTLDDTIMQMDEAELHDQTAATTPVAIDANIETPYVGDSPEGVQNHFGALKVRVVGVGLMGISVRGYDSLSPVTLNPWTLDPNPGKEEQRICNHINERMSVRLSTPVINHWFHINKIRIFSKFMWRSRPEV